MSTQIITLHTLRFKMSTGRKNYLGNYFGALQENPVTAPGQLHKKRKTFFVFSNYFGNHFSPQRGPSFWGIFFFV